MLYVIEKWLKWPYDTKIEQKFSIFCNFSGMYSTWEEKIIKSGGGADRGDLGTTDSLGRIFKLFKFLSNKMFTVLYEKFQSYVF